MTTNYICNIETQGSSFETDVKSGRGVSVLPVSSAIPASASATSATSANGGQSNQKTPGVAAQCNLSRSGHHGAVLPDAPIA